MILTIDIGNTSISTGIFKEKGKPLFLSFRTEEFDQAHAVSIKKKLHKGAIASCVIASVVPRVEAKVKRIIKRVFNCPVSFVGRDIPLSINHQYKNIHALGIDRLVSVYGGLLLYKPPFLIIDFGTAITFDYVNQKGVFEGGLIVPGPETSLSTLAKKAALLPNEISLFKPKTVCAQNTIDAMNVGTVYGFAALTDGLIKHFKRRCRKKLTVVTTGGFASFLSPYCKQPVILRPYLTLESLAMIAIRQFN